MRLALAPMEGISDSIVRDLLSGLGGMDFCVTEFIRVVHRPVPAKVLLRECPELRNGGRTSSGVPVMVQLLGGEPEHVAESARIAVELGAIGIDLNFGCPAKRVNGSDGGASLLKEPCRVTEVVGAVRAAVDRRISVSAKIRLGWESPDDVVAVARAAAAAGPDWITIHGRTKVQMYNGSADWERIALARAEVSVPVIANGDVFDPESLARCREVTGCSTFMIGRGAFRRPNIFRWLTGLDDRPWSIERSLALLLEFAARVMGDPRFDQPDRVALNRIKGWVRAMGEAHPEIEVLFHRVKRLHDLAELVALLGDVVNPTTVANDGRDVCGFLDWPSDSSRIGRDARSFVYRRPGRPDDGPDRPDRPERSDRVRDEHERARGRDEPPPPRGSDAPPEDQRQRAEGRAAGGPRHLAGARPGR